MIAGPIRRVARPFELGEWLLPPGCSIIVGGGLMHNDPRFYDHPERFDPDRFLAQKPDVFTWVPFGGGSRRCIGAAFAQMEMDVVLRTLLQHVELIPTTDRGERRMYHGGTFAPGKSGRVRIRHRRAGPRRAGV